MRFLSAAFVLAITTCSVILPAQAQDSAPSLDEYNNLKPGLLLPDAAPAPAITQEAPVDPSKAAIKEIMTMDEIVEAYHQGKYDIAAKYLLPRAENGHHQAEELVGIMYRTGQGVPKDPEKAMTWLVKAAEAGRPLAEHHLGVIYFTGDNVKPDPIKALMWLHLAITHYPDGPEKKRAIEDRDNVSAQMNRRDRDSALEQAHAWLEKKGETALPAGPQ